MIYKQYQGEKEIRKDVEPLFVSAFPSDERPPASIYFRSFKNENKKLFAFYDNDVFVGFTSIILFEDICYVFFLAVQDEKRNQGYGSEILNTIKEMYSDYVILLCYEEVDKKYKDYEKRAKRAEFYAKNGFKINPLKTNEFGVVFQTAYIGNRIVSFDEYRQIFEFGFGKWCVKFLKEA